MKFASKFRKSLAFDDTTILAKVEDYYTPGEILAPDGSSLSNFNKVSDAVKDVEYLVQKNMEANGWSMADHPSLLDEEKPEYSRYWYVKGKGKETSWTQTQSKKLVGDASLKGLAQLQSACKAMEMLGWSEDPAAAASGAIIENVKYSLLMKEIELLKST